MRLCAVDGLLVIDRERRLGGRGVYVCRDAVCAGCARRRGALSRKLKCTLMLPADLVEQVSMERPEAAWKD